MISVISDFCYHTFYYREYLWQSVGRDMRKKYKRSSLGYLWSMLNPLLMMAILTVVFSNIMRHQVDNYPVFLFSGMLTWGVFDSTCNGALGVIRSNSRIIDQVPIPKYIFLVANCLSNLVNLLLAFVPLLIVILFTHHPVHSSLVFLPVVLLPLILFSMGIGSMIAVANVFFEDTEHLLGVVLKAVYFLCPIIYAKEMLPPWLLEWVYWNPMFQIIENVRDVVYAGVVPDLYSYTYCLLSSFITMALGLWIFQRNDEKFVYFL